MEEVEAIAAKIANGIRNQYVLSYVPRNTAADGRFRTIRVVAEARGEARGKDKLIVRTRSGYYPMAPSR